MPYLPIFPQEGFFFLPQFIPTFNQPQIMPFWQAPWYYDKIIIIPSSILVKSVHFLENGESQVFILLFFFNLVL